MDPGPGKAVKGVQIEAHCLRRAASRCPGANQGLPRSGEWLLQAGHIEGLLLSGSD